MLRHRWFARAFRLGTALCVACCAAACASFSPDAGMGAVNSIAGPTVKTAAVKISTDDEIAAASARSVQLLTSPLTAERAVRLALLNHRGLQAAYNDLGIAEAVMVKASLPPDLRLSLSGISTPVELDIERRIVADILAIATLPKRAEIASDRFHQAQLRAAMETLRVAIEVRRGYYRAVAAQQTVAAVEDAASAADSAVKLAKELVATGAMNKLDQAREEAFQADLLVQLAAARRSASAARERLVRAIGLSEAAARLKFPRALPSVPARARSLRSVEKDALKHRVDLQIARIELDALAKTYGLTRATRFVNLIEVAGVSRTQRDASGVHGTGGGAEVDLQVPIFDFGESNVREAQETYMRAVNRLAEQTVNIRSQAREAYQAYRASYDIAARYRSQILPLRKKIADELTLRYGAMQIDVFALLTEAQRRIAAHIAAIEAQRDFWLAAANLDAAIVGDGFAGNDTTAPPAANRADAAQAE